MKNQNRKPPSRRVRKDEVLDYIAEAPEDEARLLMLALNVRVEELKPPFDDDPPDPHSA